MAGLCSYLSRIFIKIVKIFIHRKYSCSLLFAVESKDFVGINGKIVKAHKWKRYDLCK